MSRSTVSSVHTTGMKKRETVWYFLYLQEKSALWKKRPIKQRQIRFFWMAIYAKHRFTGKHLLEEIADMLIAVNRPYGKSDYIPCICWGRNARFAAGFEVGGHVQIWGRIQSREYVKKLEGEEAQKRVAYEVSVSKLEYI